MHRWHNFRPRVPRLPTSERTAGHAATQEGDRINDTRLGSAKSHPSLSCPHSPLPVGICPKSCKRAGRRPQSPPTCRGRFVPDPVSYPVSSELPPKTARWLRVRWRKPHARARASGSCCWHGGARSSPERLEQTPRPAAVLNHLYSGVHAAQRSVRGSRTRRCALRLRRPCIFSAS